MLLQFGSSLREQFFEETGMYDNEKNQVSLVSVERYNASTRYAFATHVYLNRLDVIEIRPAQSKIEIKNLTVNNEVAVIKGFITMLDMSKEAKSCIP